MRKRILCIAAAFVKKVAVDAVSETSDWYTYQSEEPEEVRKLCSKLNEKNWSEHIDNANCSSSYIVFCTNYICCKLII